MKRSTLKVRHNPRIVLVRPRAFLSQPLSSIDNRFYRSCIDLIADIDPLLEWETWLPNVLVFPEVFNFPLGFFPFFICLFACLFLSRGSKFFSTCKRPVSVDVDVPASYPDGISYPHKGFFFFFSLFWKNQRVHLFMILPLCFKLYVYFIHFQFCQSNMVALK